MNQNTIAELQKYIDVNTPIIYINDFDFARVDEVIGEVVGKSRIVEWNQATGTTDFRTRRSVGYGVRTDLVTFLREIYTFEIEDDLPVQEKFIVLRDIQDEIEKPEVKSLLSLIAQRELYDRQFSVIVFIVSSVNRVPEELSQYVTFLEIYRPDDMQINDLIEEHILANGYNDFKPSDRESLMPSLKGLTAYEIDRILDMAMSNNGTLTASDAEMILKQKKMMVRKSGLVELVDNNGKSGVKIEDIGGLDCLKDYLVKKAEIFRNLAEAEKYGVSIPKGVFLVGMPGCGKSLCAKAAASAFHAPLLKLDMGSMMGKYVGQSEENLRKAIKIAEAAAPCILWIDEIEKAFSGVNGQSDAVLTRMFGNFLSWMQEKTSTVYVIATANNADALPPELKRKGRFDELFCVNLPNEEERKKIFEVHLGKLKDKGCMKDGYTFDAVSLAKATAGFNGADIEAVVHDAVEECFLRANGQQKIDTQDVLKMAKNTVSITKSCRKQIDAMKKVFGESSFRDATTGKITRSDN